MCVRHMTTSSLEHLLWVNELVVLSLQSYSCLTKITLIFQDFARATKYTEEVECFAAENFGTFDVIEKDEFVAVIYNNQVHKNTFEKITFTCLNLYFSKC